MVHWCAVVVAFLLASVAGVAGQSAEEEVRKAMQDGAVAARNGDKAAYARFLADDLRWIRTDDGSMASNSV